MTNAIGSTFGSPSIGSGHDRRTNARIHVSWSAKLRLPDSIALIPGKVTDASFGGVAFVSSQLLKAGMHCTLIIDLPNQASGAITPASAAVTVLNCIAIDGSHQYRTNLHFDVLPGNLRTVLETHLRKLG
jgi:hypothetical protein